MAEDSALMGRPSESVYLVDASIYIFRAWFVLPDSLRSIDDEPVNAVYGFAEFLYQLINEEKPGRLACCFDESLSSSCRNEIYPAYKANRDPAPEDLKRQFQWCRELTRRLGIAEFASAEFEADDLIGTFAKLARRQGQRSVIVTGDKDLTQVIGEHDEWWDFARKKRLDSRGVHRQWGVLPGQIADLLALTGDKVDNIPGIPGVGPATAARLLTRWIDIDGIYTNLDRVAGMKFRGAARVATLLAEHEPTVRLARRLTEILDVPGLPDSTDALRPAAPDLDGLDALFDQLGFGATRRQRWLSLFGSA